MLYAYCTLEMRVQICYNYVGGGKMPIKYKIDVLAKLKNAGYSSYKLRQKKLFGERTIQKFRTGEMVSAANLATICKLLNCQPGDILEYEKDGADE